MAAALLGLALAEAAVAAGAGAWSGLGWDRLVDLLVFSNAVIGLALAVSGWPIAGHRPRNPIGWLLLAGGLCFLTTAAGTALLGVASAHDLRGPGWTALATVVNAAFPWMLCPLLPLVLLLFPDGRLPGPRWRLLAVPLAAGALLFAASSLVPTMGLASELGYDDPIGWDAPALRTWGGPLATVSIACAYLGALAALVVRYRRGGERTRRRLLWLVPAASIMVAVFLADAVLDLQSVFAILPIALVPLAIMVAVLRHELLDIRLVISRSVLYLLLTLGVVAAYLALITMLDGALRRHVPAGASVAATLVIALAFNPVRIVLQRLLDRSFYGARRDPLRAVAEVGARLGDADGGLDGVLESLCGALKLPSASIVVRGGRVAAYGTPAEVRHVFPLRHGDDELGELVIGLRAGESRLDPSDERVIGLLAAPVAVAVHAGLLADRAGELAEALRRSRERVITGREEERRRMRRDLHDGLGPILTGVVLNADAARHLLATDPARAGDLLGTLREQATEAVDDIRRLVYDLRPPALDGMGLTGALREHALALTRRADGSPLTVTVHATEPAPELPAAVEVAAYRIVTEALTNVARHSTAASATVVLASGPDALRLRVEDDGANHAPWVPGVGLGSIRERAAELGGTCDLDPAPTGGRVSITIPLGKEPA